jgi:hypothetical protein
MSNEHLKKSICEKYKILKEKYGRNFEFKITSLLKKDIYLTQYYFEVNDKKKDITHVRVPIRVYDSDDDYVVNDLSDGAIYDENENVPCIYIDHIRKDNEKYEYYKKIFIDNLMYGIAKSLKHYNIDKDDEIDNYLTIYYNLF